MFGALLYLRLTSLQNWLRMRLGRLKQPKYLVGAIAGGLYFWFFFFRRGVVTVSTGSGARSRAAQQALHATGVALPDNLTGIGLAIAATLLLVLLTLAWVLSLERASLGFSEAEIAFLFPAPITRQRLVHFRLVDMQLRNLLGAVFMTVFTNRFTFLGGSRLAHAAGWWLIFTTFSLHLAGVRFTLTRLADAGLRTWPRRALVLLALAAVIGVTLALLPADQRWVDLGARNLPRTLGQWILDVTSVAPLAWLLWPAKWLLGPFFAPDWATFLSALGPALFVVALHYLWVVRSVVSFEDGSIERAQKVATRLAARRSGQRLGRAPTKGRPPPFVLGGRGRPELAFLWKNLLGAWGWLNLRTWGITALAIVGAVTWARSQPNLASPLLGAGVMALIVAGYVLLVGPQFARQDIRSDLANADLLKTYPLRGWQIVLGELLTPVAILTGVIWLALLAAALAFQPREAALAGFYGSLAAYPKIHDFAVSCLAPAGRPVLALCLAAIVPPLVAMQLFVPNAAALMFPAWFQSIRQRGGSGGGIDVMGQRLIFFFAQLLTILLALLPTLVAGAIAVAVGCFVLGLPALIGIWLATLGIVAVLLGELWFGLQFLGHRFEQIDLSAELRP
jgi:putative ABC exporter